MEPRSGIPGTGIWKCLPWNENEPWSSARADDLHRLLEHLAVELVGGLLVGVVVGSDRDALVVEVQHLTRHRAAADAEDRPPAGQVVQRGEVLGEAQRVPLRHDVEHRAEADVRRPRRDPRRDLQAVRDHLVALVLEVVLGRPERVVAEPVGLDRRVDVVERRLPALLVAWTAGPSAPAGPHRRRPSRRPRRRTRQLHSGSSSTQASPRYRRTRERNRPAARDHRRRRCRRRQDRRCDDRRGRDPRSRRSPTTSSSTSTAICCSRPPSSPTPTSTRRSSPSGSRTRPAT